MLQNCDFLKESCQKIWKCQKFLVILQPNSHALHVNARMCNDEI